MVFEVRIKPSAKEDLLKAIAYYNKINPILSQKFYSEFSGLNALLARRPHFAIKYKTIKTCKLKSFPYLIHFVVNEESKLVTIIAIKFGESRISDL